MLSCNAFASSCWLSLTLLTLAYGCKDEAQPKYVDASMGPSGSGGKQSSHGGSGGSTTGGSTAMGSGGQDYGGGVLDSGSGGADAAVMGPSWVADVYPALIAGCGGCHGDPIDNDGGVVIGIPGIPGGPGEATGDGPGKFAVSDAHAAYEAVRPFAIPGDATHSILYIKISQDSPSTGGMRMPPALRQWDQASIDLVSAWIEAGAVEN